MRESSEVCVCVCVCACVFRHVIFDVRMYCVFSGDVRREITPAEHFLTHPETGRFPPYSPAWPIPTSFHTFVHIETSFRVGDVNSRLQNVYMTHSEYGDKGPP